MKFYIIFQFIITFSVLIVIIAVFTDFLFFHNKNRNIQKNKKSIIETGTMFLFFLLYYLFIINQFTYITIENNLLKKSFISIGTLMILGGALGNITGRFNLGNNWGNHILIYKEHQLITTGMYKFVRHPLYSTIILMFFGGSLVYTNIGSFIITVLIFIPSMIYRIKQEEKLLTQIFQDYESYRKKTGMLFPKLFRRCQK